MVENTNVTNSTSTPLIRKLSTAASSRASSIVSSFECQEYKRLHDILSTPEQLAFFQTYLQNIHAHESLLFIEALSELRHESSFSNIEQIVNRFVFIRF